MGKALITGGGEAGLYTIKPLHKREHIEAEIERIEAQLAETEEPRAELEEQLNLAELEVQEARWVLDGLIQELYEDQSLGLIDLNALITEHNLARASNGRSALTGVSSLHTAAQKHARWLAENDRSGHTGEGGSTPCGRILSAGYNWTVGGSCGENVVVGTAAPSVEKAMQLWMSSAGHRNNILNPGYQHIGVGYARRMDSSLYRHFWVATFGSLGPGQSASPGSPTGPEYVGNEGALMPLSDALAEAQIALVEAAARRDKLRTQWDAMEARDAASRDRLVVLQAIPDDPVQQAWCVDFTQTLGSEKATIEIPGEGNQRIWLRPGHAGRADYDPARDGQLHHRAGLSGPQAYFNAAILPGWQRWMPTYRLGTLTSVDKIADTGSVSLDVETSSAISLPINGEATLTGIPIEYMTCNAAVFEVGDRVVVEFSERNWESAKVIGFQSDPKSCSTVLVRYLVQTVNSRAGLLIEGDATQEVPIGGNATPVTVVQDDRTYALGYMMWFIGWDDGVMSSTRHDTNVQEGFTVTALRVMFPAKLLLHPGGVPASGQYAFSANLARAGAMWSNYPSTAEPLGNWTVNYSGRSKCDDPEEPTKSVPVFFNYNFAAVYFVMGSFVNQMHEGSVTRLPFAGVAGENDCIWESASSFSGGSQPGAKSGRRFWLDGSTVYYWETNVSGYDYDTCGGIDHARCNGSHERSSWARTNTAWWTAIPGISTPGVLQVQHDNVSLTLEYAVSDSLDPDTGYKVYLPPPPDF